MKVQEKKKKVDVSFKFWAKREIRHFHVVVVRRRQRNVQKKRDARAKLLFCQSQKPIAFCRLFVVVAIVVFFFFFYLFQVKYTQKRKKLHRINKVIKRKEKRKKKQTNSEFTHLHGNTYKY